MLVCMYVVALGLISAGVFSQRRNVRPLSDEALQLKDSMAAGGESEDGPNYKTESSLHGSALLSPSSRCP